MTFDYLSFVDTKLLIGCIIGLVTFSCTGKKANGLEKSNVPEIINRISETQEYKMAEKRIDSLKARGVKVDIQIVVLPDLAHPEDSVKKISTAFIEENYGFDQNELYEIKFDNMTQKIVSITKTPSTPINGFEKVEKVGH